MRIYASASLLLAVLFGCSTGTSLERVPQMEIGLGECHFKVPEPYYSGYSAFSLVVDFEVNPDGATSDVEVRSNLPGIDGSKIRRCVAAWRFGRDNDPPGRWLASFRWDRNYGWTVLRISNSRSELVAEVELAGRC